jgi:hypothetical protein
MLSDKMNALKNLENLSRVKQREVFCPTANVRLMTTPLVATDDLLLRTTIASVDTYDRELTRLLYNHSIFHEVEEGKQISFNEYINFLSYLDRQVILWGVFESSYGTLGEQEIDCPFCKYKFKDEITAMQVLQEDSLTLWDEKVPFTEYTHIVEKIVDVEGIYKIQFVTCLPTIKHHLDVLSLIPNEKLRDNFAKFGSILAKTEELTSITKEIRVFRINDDAQAPDIFDTPQDLHLVISEYILLDIVNDVLDDYNERFTKYVPVFKKPYTCGRCGKDFDFYVDIEVSLFRRFLGR